MNDAIRMAATGLGQPQQDVPDLSLKPRTLEEKRELIAFFQNKKTKRTKMPEQVFAIPIQLGILRIVRQKGRGPKVEWI